MCNYLKPALPGLILLFIATFGLSKETAINRLETVAKKYQDIGSYEASATASRSLEPGIEARIRLELAYASSELTPPNLPVPMLPTVIRMSRFETIASDGKPVKANGKYAGPGPHFSFDQVARRVTDAKHAGTESLTIGGILRTCDIIEALYEPTREKISDPVRYWIESSSNTIWRFQFSERDPLSKSGDIIRWTVTFDKWIENKPPPQWLIDVSTKFAGQESSVLVGHAAPDISGQTTTGIPFQLSKLQGKVVVLDFWATWCGPCSEEMAALERLMSTLKGQDVEIWGITEDKPELAKRWLAERKRTLPGVLVEPSTAFKQYGVESLPAVVVIDPKGNVARHWVGLRTEKDVREAVQKVLTGPK